MSKTSIKIFPLGGLGEIGMNCLVIDTGKDAIMIDCGLLFTDLSDFGVEYAIPDFKLLEPMRDRLRGLIVTHGHEDHIGAIPYLEREKLYLAVYATEFAQRLVGARLDEAGLLDRFQLNEYKYHQEFTVGSFSVTPIPVNHSIIEASALKICVEGKTILHTGDFKIDSSPFYGSELDLDTFKKIGDEGVDLLLSDSTNVERLDPSKSEASIFEFIEHTIAAAQGLTILSMFSSNIGRMGQVLEMAAKMGKKIAFTGRSMQRNLVLAQESGYLKHASQVLVDIDDFEQVPRNKLIVIATGSQGEYRSALFRISMGEHKTVQLQKGDQVILSSKFIPGNELAISRLINNLFRQGAEVLYESLHAVHVSGHAARPELKKMLEAIRPKNFIPVHGEYRHLVHHSRLAVECGVKPDHVLTLQNGDSAELIGQKIERGETVEAAKVLCQMPKGSELSREMLRARRKMAEGGSVFVGVTRQEDSGRIVSGPSVIINGVVPDEVLPDMIQDLTEMARERVASECRHDFDDRLPTDQLEEELRIDVRRFFNQRLGRKPPVFTMILDL